MKQIRKFNHRVAMKNSRGFSLIELLAVMSIIVVMMSVAVPGLVSLKGAHNVSQSAFDIADTLELARSQAMARNTYVFVGIYEVDNKLTVAVVGSKDGSNNYDASGQWRGDSNLAALNKIKVLDSVHMADFSSLNASSGQMASRRTVAPTSSLGNSGVGDKAVFYWPLGLTSGTKFTKVIQFDPRGIATLQNGVSTADSVQRMEIGLQKANGKELPAAVTDISTGTIAAVQLDGVTGITRIYQP